MRGDSDDVTVVFRIAYEVAVTRCDLCPLCGKAPTAKAILIKDPGWGAGRLAVELIAVCDACYDAGRGELISN